MIKYIILTLLIATSFASKFNIEIICDDGEKYRFTKSLDSIQMRYCIGFPGNQQCEWAYKMKLDNGKFEQEYQYNWLYADTNKIVFADGRVDKCNVIHKKKNKR